MAEVPVEKTIMMLVMMVVMISVVSGVALGATPPTTPPPSPPVAEYCCPIEPDVCFFTYDELYQHFITVHPSDPIDIIWE